MESKKDTIYPTTVSKAKLQEHAVRLNYLH